MCIIGGAAKGTMKQKLTIVRHADDSNILVVSAVVYSKFVVPAVFQVMCLATTLQTINPNGAGTRAIASI